MSRNCAALILICYTLALLFLALGPSVGLTVNPGLELKLHHIAAFAVHTILVWAYVRTFVPKPLSARLISALITFLFSAGIEAAQLLFPSRSGRWQDLFHNLVGILIAQVVLHFAMRSSGVQR